MTLHIYTGYNWRPMNTDEIEIMCQENMVSEMKEDAHAGDIFQDAEE